MHITHIAEHNLLHPDNLSGTPYWISKGLAREQVDLYHLHISRTQQLLSLKQELLFRCKQKWIRLTKNGYLDSLTLQRALHIAQRIEGRLQHIKTDAILTSITPSVAAFLEAKQPIIYWTDALYAGLIGFYPNYCFHHPDTVWDYQQITAASLANARLLIFASTWAARHAIEFYGVPQDKIKIVPFGANLEIEHTHADVKEMVHARDNNDIHLLFIGKEWFRKGGDIALAVTKALHTKGYPVKLTIAGCEPDEPLPPYVKCEGLISKKTPEGVAKLKRLYQMAHFFIMPSRAEAYGIVFCEANAFGVPCISTYVGGIPDVVKENVNGMTFSLQATVDQYCDYIIRMLADKKRYADLALSSFNEYESRLNWRSASQQVKRLIAEVI